MAPTPLSLSTRPALVYRANWSIFLPWTWGTWERHLKLAVAHPSLSTRPAGNFSIEFVTAALRLVPHTHTYPGITLWSWGWWNRHRQLIHISGQHKLDWQKQSRCNNFGTQSNQIGEKMWQLYQIFIHRKKAWFCRIACSPKLFTLACKYFDTDISVTFRDSGYNIYSGSLEMKKRTTQHRRCQTWISNEKNNNERTQVKSVIRPAVTQHKWFFFTFAENINCFQKQNKWV